MKIKNIKKTLNSSFCIEIDNDVVNLSYDLIFDKNNPDDDEFYTLSFNRSNYEKGIEKLIDTKSCLITGKFGNLEILMKNNGLYDIVIQTQSRIVKLENEMFEFYE